MGNILSSGQLDVCHGNAYPKHPRRFSHQVRSFFLAYTQADVKSEIFMELPIGFRFEGDHPRERIIRMDKNVYGMKDAGLTWFEKIK